MYGQSMTTTATAVRSGTRNKPLALAYVRVSTTDQADNGASLEAQKAQLTVEADRRGWDLQIMEDAAQSAKSLKRPALQEALDMLDKGKADHLMSIRLDRVSRSVSDFAGLMDRAARRGWGIVLLSPNVDTSDPAGRFTANVLASAAQYERELIGLRTKEGMAQRKAEGVIMGRRRAIPSETVDFIRAARKRGESLRKIADAMNEACIPTPQGGKRWYASSVKSAIDIYSDQEQD